MEIEGLLDKILDKGKDPLFSRDIIKGIPWSRPDTISPYFGAWRKAK